MNYDGMLRRSLIGLAFGAAIGLRAIIADGARGIAFLGSAMIFGMAWMLVLGGPRKPSPTLDEENWPTKFFGGRLHRYPFR